MLLDLIGGFDAANPMVTVLELAQLLIIVLLTLTVHEVAHGWAAKKLGDDTAERQGRLSLNPVNHLDPIGFLCMLIAGFGWAKPVPINARRFKNPKLGMAISALAGPLSNLLMAFAAVGQQPAKLLVGNISNHLFDRVDTHLDTCITFPQQVFIVCV